MILLFAFLVGSIIAAFTATVASSKDAMPAKSQIINCGIATVLGFILFNLVLLIILSISINLFAQSQTDAIGFYQSLPIIIYLTLPNAVVGGGIIMHCWRRGKSQIFVIAEEQRQAIRILPVWLIFQTCY